MSLSVSILIIILAALIHSSFQLSVSVLTILSGHSIGANHTQKKLFGLTTSFIFGVGLVTLLLLTSILFLLLNIFSGNIPQIIWAGSCGLLFGAAVSVWLFYYRREKGTTLWIPRGMAEYLLNRTKSTESKAEAFGLGVSSVLGEILFIIAPLMIGGLAITNLPAPLQLIGVLIYSFISILSLLIVWILIGNGYKLSKIQKWRETNKYFLQFIAGTGLIILSVFVYVYEILSTAVGGIQ